MPHLSPMNWLLALLTFWFLLSMMMTGSWWTQQNSFKMPNSSASKAHSNNWHWL